MIERLKTLHLTPESVLQLVDEGGYHMMSHDTRTHDVYIIHVYMYMYMCVFLNVQ